MTMKLKNTMVAGAEERELYAWSDGSIHELPNADSAPTYFVSWCSSHVKKERSRPLVLSSFSFLCCETRRVYSFPFVKRRLTALLLSGGTRNTAGEVQLSSRIVFLLFIPPPFGFQIHVERQGVYTQALIHIPVPCESIKRERERERRYKSSLSLSLSTLPLVGRGVVERVFQHPLLFFFLLCFKMLQ